MSAPTREYHSIDSPHLGNQFLEDSPLQSYLNYFVPDSILQRFVPDLTQWGGRCVGDLQAMGRDAEQNPAYLQQYDAWGHRIDIIHTAAGYEAMKTETARQGLVAAAYERKYGVFSRLLQTTKWYLLSGAQGVNYTCNIGMADGCARVLMESLLTVDLSATSRAFVEYAFDRITSTDPAKFWDSGQWMTEKTGGSDVQRGETVARLQPDGTYSLHGFKFFTSGSNSDVTLALACVVTDQFATTTNAKGEQVTTSKPVQDKTMSLFLIRLRNDNGELNNLIVHKMKSKLGTKAMPTTELELVGTRAVLVSERGRGVASIAPLLNISRVGVSYTLAGGMMRRALALARDWCHRRGVHGGMLTQQPLHLHTLANLEITMRACMIMGMKSCLLLGESETAMHEAFQHYRIMQHSRIPPRSRSPPSSSNRSPYKPNTSNTSNTSGDSASSKLDLFRIIAPMVKLYICHTSVGFVSEAMECIGGNAYMEDSGVPQLLRDCQAQAIWEGTTNVCTMDVVRALQTRPHTMGAFVSECESLLKHARVNFNLAASKSPNAGRFVTAFASLENALKIIHTFVLTHVTNQAQPSSSTARVTVTGNVIVGKDMKADTTLSYTKLPPWLSVMRHVVLSMARIFAACLLLDRSLDFDSDVEPIDQIAALRYIQRWFPASFDGAKLTSTMDSDDNVLLNYHQFTIEQLKQLSEEDRILALDVDRTGQPRGCGDKARPRHDAFKRDFHNKACPISGATSGECPRKASSSSSLYTPLYIPSPPSPAAAAVAVDTAPRCPFSGKTSTTSNGSCPVKSTSAGSGACPYKSGSTNTTSTPPTPLTPPTPPTPSECPFKSGSHSTSPSPSPLKNAGSQCPFASQQCAPGSSVCASSSPQLQLQECGPRTTRTTCPVSGAAGGSCPVPFSTTNKPVIIDRVISQSSCQSDASNSNSNGDRDRDRRPTIYTRTRVTTICVGCAISGYSSCVCPVRVPSRL